MDIEGAEGLALEGMKKILNENKDIKIFSEIVPGALIKTGISGEDYLNMLTSAGFSIYEIIEGSKEKIKLINPSQFREFINRITSTNIFCKRDNKNVA